MLDAIKEITMEVLVVGHLTSTMEKGTYGAEPLLGLKVMFTEGAIILALELVVNKIMMADPSTS
jgi:hypothetical protein